MKAKINDEYVLKMLRELKEVSSQENFISSSFKKQYPHFYYFRNILIDKGIFEKKYGSGKWVGIEPSLSMAKAVLNIYHKNLSESRENYRLNKNSYAENTISVNTESNPVYLKEAIFELIKTDNESKNKTEYSDDTTLSMENRAEYYEIPDSVIQEDLKQRVLYFESKITNLESINQDLSLKIKEKDIIISEQKELIEQHKEAYTFLQSNQTLFKTDVRNRDRVIADKEELIECQKSYIEVLEKSINAHKENTELKSLSDSIQVKKSRVVRKIRLFGIPIFSIENNV